MDDRKDLEAAGRRRESPPVGSPAVNPAKEAANRRLAEALRANLKRRKAAGSGEGGARPTGDRRG